MKRRAWTIGAVAVAAAAAGAVWRERRSERPAAPAATPGSPAIAAGGDAALSEFWSQSVELLDGSRMPLSSLLGQRLLVNFWATWCPPCIREMPLIDQFHNEFGAGTGPKAWRVLGLAIDRRDAVVEFLRRQPVGYDIALAGLEGTSWSRALGNDKGGLPFTVAIDEKGSVRQRKIGEITASELRSWAVN